MEVGVVAIPKIEKGRNPLEVRSNEDGLGQT